MRGSFFALFAVLFAFSVQAQSDTCFFANGSPLPSDNTLLNKFKPCTSGGPRTICCATGRSNPPGGDINNGDTSDECLPNGLCQNRFTKNGVNSTGYFVNFCTDSNVTSGNCLNICGETRTPFGNTAITPCNGRADSPTWCCGQDRKECCSSGIGIVKLPQIFGGILSSTSTLGTSFTRPSTIARSTIPTTRTNAPTGSDSPTSLPVSTAPSSEISRAGVAGIVVGIIVIIILFSTAIFFAIRAEQYKRQAEPQPKSSGSSIVSSPPLHGRYEVEGAEKDVKVYAELHETPRRAELPSLPSLPSELPGGDGRYR